MTTELSIKADESHLTVVNMLTPPEGQQARLVELLTSGIANEMSPRNGFLSASIHQSLDSDHVLVYAQWTELAALQAAAAAVERGEAPNMRAAYELANPSYHPYRITAVVTGSGTKD